MDAPTTTPSTPPAAAPALTMALGELADAEAAIARLLDAQLPAVVAYRVAKLARLVKVETQFFHERREALIRELGVEVQPTDAERAQGATSMIRVRPECGVEFTTRLREVADVVVSLSIAPLTLADLAPASMTGADVLRLGPLVVESSP